MRDRQNHQMEEQKYQLNSSDLSVSEWVTSELCRKIGGVYMFFT